MSDQERPAQALRSGLDRELAQVHATAEARERLTRAIEAGTDRDLASPPRRWRPILALPVAGALVAAVIAGAVVIPTALQTDPEPGIPSGPGPEISVPYQSPPTPTSEATVPASPTAMPVPSMAPRSSAPTVPGETAQARALVEAETPRSASTLRLRFAPTSPSPGQRVVLTVNGVPARHGEITVTWGDRSADGTVADTCEEPSTVAETPALAHSYVIAGSYRVQVRLAGCGAPAETEATVVVAQN